MTSRYITEENRAEWEADCLKWRGKVLTGEFAHWCFEFDGLPTDETCKREWDCCTCCDDDRPDRITEEAFWAGTQPEGGFTFDDNEAEAGLGSVRVG